MGDYSVTLDTPQGAVDMDSMAARHTKEAEKLRGVCRDFEGVFLGVLMKEGIKLDEGEDGEGGAANASLMDASIEQTAQAMGQSGSSGIGDIFYDYLSSSLPSAGKGLKNGAEHGGKNGRDSGRP